MVEKKENNQVKIETVTILINSLAIILLCMGLISVRSEVKNLKEMLEFCQQTDFTTSEGYAMCHGGFYPPIPIKNPILIKKGSYFCLD